jgi:dUTP pyrophosphatase
MEGEKELQVKLVSEDAVLPQYGSDAAAGLDLVSPKDATIPAWGSALIDLGIQMVIPTGYYGRIASRSSLALRGIEVGAGVIDADYRGNVKVLIRNHSNNDFVIGKFYRCAQMIITPCAHVKVAASEDLSTTARGAGGFGSTGK